MKESDQIIFGIYPIEEAIKAQVNLDKVYIQQGTTNPKILSLIEKLESQDTSVQFVPVERLNRLTKGNHQGIVALSSPIKFRKLEELVEETLSLYPSPLFIILDQITDVRNFGAILRTAECTGVHGIIIPKTGGAPVTGDTARTSAGALFRIPIAKVSHVKDAIFYFQASGIKTIAATEKTDRAIYSVDLKSPLAIVMGSEEKGISPSVLKSVDERAALPLLGEINSLNVSVACGAILYEVIRQRNY